MLMKLQPPRAPPDHLRLQSFQILSRLQLIKEFQPWLTATRDHVFRRHDTPLELLWDCFAFGAPLGTLLNLLGSPSPSHLVEKVNNFDFGIGVEEREDYFGRIPYGEVLRCEDFLSPSSSTFAKVLRAVYRVLITLEETYPGLFVTPFDSQEQRRDLLRELAETEKAHLSILKIVLDVAQTLAESLEFAEPRVRAFHETSAV